MKMKQVSLAALCLILLLGMTAFQSASAPITDAPVDAAWTGSTSRGHSMSFTVSSGGTQWSTFKLKTDFVASNCGASGTMEITVPGPGSISGNQFSYTSSTFSFTGQFTSASAASGTYSFTNRQIVIGIPYPPYVCYYYLTQSGTWSASTPLPSPGEFNKSGPAAGATNVSLNPTLIWNTSAYADNYQYCIDTVDNNDCDTLWEPNPGTSNTSIGITGLAAETTYYWQVRAVNSTGATMADGNAWWSFRTTGLLTLRSTGAQDGWVLESSESSNKGGTMNSAATTLRLGDDAAKKQYRSILSFATGAALPDEAVITKVTLKIKKQGVVGGGNPAATFGGFILDVRKGTFGMPALQITDWQTAANKSYGPFKPALVGGWYSFDLSAAKAYINKLSMLSGLTQIRLRFKLDDNNNALANYLSVFSGNAPAASRPQLIIEYYTP